MENEWKNGAVADGNLKEIKLLEMFIISKLNIIPVCFFLMRMKRNFSVKSIKGSPTGGGGTKIWADQFMVGWIHASIQFLLLNAVKHTK